MVNTHVKRMEEIRLETHNIVMSNAGLREELLRTIEYLKGVRKEFEVVKQDVGHLQTLDRQLKDNFVMIERTYFSSQDVKRSTSRKAY